MDDTLNSDLGQNVCMDAKSESIDVLGTSIRSVLSWDDHVFNVSKEAAKCLGFLILPISALSTRCVQNVSRILNFRALLIFNFRFFCGVMLVQMFFILNVQLIFDSDDFCLFQKMDQRICIK